jgi:hypothetical protein
LINERRGIESEGTGSERMESEGIWSGGIERKCIETEGQNKGFKGECNIAEVLNA